MLDVDESGPTHTMTPLVPIEACHQLLVERIKNWAKYTPTKSRASQQMGGKLSRLSRVSTCNTHAVVRGNRERYTETTP